MPKMLKKWGVTDFVSQRTCPEDHPKSEKIEHRWRKMPVSLSPKSLQLNLRGEMFSAIYYLSGPIK